MLFNFGKCKCLHIGPGNTSMNYEMGGTILSTTVKEKDRSNNGCEHESLRTLQRLRLTRFLE